MARIIEIQVDSYEVFQEKARRYELLRRKKEKLERIMATLAEDIMPMVKMKKEVTVEDYVFKYRCRKNRIFTAKVSELEVLVAARKEYEIKRGLAKETDGAEYFVMEEIKR